MNIFIKIGIIINKGGKLQHWQEPRDINLLIGSFAKYNN